MKVFLAWSIRHHYGVLAIALALTVAAAVCARGIRVQLDARSLLPAGDEVLQESDAAQRLFGTRDSVLVVLSADRGAIFTREGLELLSRTTDDVRRLPGVAMESVVSLATLPRFQITGHELSIGGTLLPRRGPPADADVRAARTAVLGGDPRIAVLVSRDQRAAAVVAEVFPDADRFTLLDATRRIAARVPDNYTMYISGSALAQAELGRTTAQELAVLLPLVLTVVAIGLWIALRRASQVFASLVEIGASLVCTAGVLGLAGETVFVSTLILPVVLIVVGVSDDVFALRCFAEARRGLPLPMALARGFGRAERTVTLTALCTVVGLGSLSLSGVEPLRVLGVYGSLAVFLSWLCTFTLVPALLMSTGRTGRADHRSLRVPGWMHAWLAPRHPALRLAAVVLVAGVLANECLKLRVDDSWIRNLPPSSDLVAGERFVSGRFAGTMRLDVIVDGGAAGTAFSTPLLAAVGELERRLAALPEVGAVIGPYGAGAAVARSLSDDRGAAGPPTAADAAAALPLLEAVAPAMLVGLTDGDRRRARVSAIVRTPDYRRIDRVAASAAAAVPVLKRGGAAGVVLSGDAWVSHRTVRRLVSSQLVALPLAIATDLLVLTCLLRSLRSSLTAMLPVVTTVTAMGAALSATGVPLGIANSMSAAIVLSVGVDFSVQLVAARREQQARGHGAAAAAAQAVRRTAPAILGSALSLAAGFAVLGGAAAAPTRQLGLVTALAVLSCALFTLTMLPALWHLTGRSAVARRQESVFVSGGLLR